MEQNKPHKHKDLIIAWANGAEIQRFHPNSAVGWVNDPTPSWNPFKQYRIKPEEDPYKKFKEAFNAGQTIQVYDGILKDWIDAVKTPCFILPVSYYHIKPELKHKLVPFTWTDRQLLRGKWIKSKTSYNEFCISHIKVLYNDLYIDGLSSKFLLENYTFLDDKPFGKYIEYED